MRKVIINFIFIFSLSPCFLAQSVFAQIEKAQKTYEFTNSEYCEEAKAQIDNLALELQKQPDAIIYIVYYGGKNYPIYERKKDKEEIQLPRYNEAKDRIE